MNFHEAVEGEYQIINMEMEEGRKGGILGIDDWLSQVTKKMSEEILDF